MDKTLEYLADHPVAYGTILTVLFAAAVAAIMLTSPIQEKPPPV